MTHLRLALIRFALMKINSRNLLFVTLVAIIAALSAAPNRSQPPADRKRSSLRMPRGKRFMPPR